MATATHKDVVRLIPEIQDHAIVEILGMDATIAEIEAALAAMTSDEQDLAEIEHREGDRIHRLLHILSQSLIEPADDRDM